MAAMVLPRPSTSGTRPAYLDNLFREDTLPRLPPLKSPSLRSANSSISFNATSPLDPRVVHSIPRPLSPAYEEEQQDDRISVRSLRSFRSSRLKLRNILNRNTYPNSRNGVEYPTDRSTPSHSHTSRRPSLPKLQTVFTSPSRKGHPITSKPLPPPPPPLAETLECQKCYYFAARHCNGYVMGGSHGDACDTCAQAGFFGAP